MRRELFRAGFVGAMREAEKEVIAGFADVASIESAGRVNVQCVGKKAGNRRHDRGNFALASGGTGASEDCASRRQHRGVLDKGRVRMAEVSFEHRESEATFAQRLAICRV